MKINLSTYKINDKVCDWANENGKKIHNKIKNVSSYTEYEVDKKVQYYTESMVEAYVERLEYLVFSAIMQVIPSVAQYSMSNFFTEKIESFNNKYFVYIDFNENALRRESLNPSSQGVDNIIALFSNGYEIKKCKPPYPYGNWHGKKTYALRHREHNDFLSDVINDFNRSYCRNIAVVLNKKYTNTKDALFEKEWNDLMNNK